MSPLSMPSRAWCAEPSKRPCQPSALAHADRWPATASPTTCIRFGRVDYAGSTATCVPTSPSQPGARALGAQAGEKQLRAALAEAGFARIRRAAATPFNLVIEAPH